MQIMVPPHGDRQDEVSPTNHPDLPEMGDDEDYVEYIGRVAEWLEVTPPAAPSGFVLIECGAEPRHMPEYRVAEDVFYPAPCAACESAASYASVRELQCKAKHRPWKSWAVWRKLATWTYVTGITASGGGTSYGRCEFCGVGRQHMAPRWRGKRHYILGKRRDEWSCLRRGHRFSPLMGSDLCTICLPCPDCGSADQDHYQCQPMRPVGGA